MAVLKHAERLDNAHPKLIAFAQKLAANSSLDICVVTGARSAADAKRLWEEGRTTAGPHAGDAGYPELGQTVTNAKDCAHTAHSVRVTPEGEFGCAMDLQYIVPRGALMDMDTAEHREIYEAAGILAEDEGLNWGGRFPKVDAAHFEMPDWHHYPLAD